MNRPRVKPGPGEESVWDYPRPPRVQPSSARIRVVAGGQTIADSTRSLRILETSHPPVYYIPPNDVSLEHLQQVKKQTFCEWKGLANYYDLVIGSICVPQVAWSYHQPATRFAEIQDCLAFYPSKVEACYVDDERVSPQAGDFYGGWITSKIVGPFKGGPGTRGW